MVPSILIYFFQSFLFFVCFFVCICILSFFHRLDCVCICTCGPVQRISCDQCDPFAVGLLVGANVLSTGSHIVDSFIDKYLYLSMSLYFSLCFYFLYVAPMNWANVLSSGSHTIDSFADKYLSLYLSLSLSLYSSSRYDRKHRPLYGNISYEGSGMSLG